jgi:DNA-binding SARP family transcriptional activator
VGPDGRVDTAEDPPARLSVLGSAATGDLLAVYRQAHTPPPAPVTPGDTWETGVTAPVRVPRQAPTAPAGQPTPAIASAATQAGRVRLAVLGPPAVYRPGETVPVRWARTAALPVLVFLAVQPAGATSTELAAMLWPQLPTHTTTNRVYNIMRTVHEALDDAADGPTIVRAGDRYRLNPQYVEVDLWRLREAIQPAVGPDPADRPAGLRRVIDVYTGDLAHGWPWPWLAPHREATRRQVLDAYTALSAAQPDPASAGELLRAAAAVDPDNDELRRRTAGTDPQPRDSDVTHDR